MLKEISEQLPTNPRVTATHPMRTFCTICRVEAMENADTDCMILNTSISARSV